MLPAIFLTMTINITANTDYNVRYEEYAKELKKLGVFKGTSTGFELDREPTRLEAAVMFVRLLGTEQEAHDKKYEHPYTDVPKWGNDYIGYLYHEGLTNGTGNNKYGSADFISAESYFTFILRALGYDDSKKDFIWNESLEYVRNNKLINELDYKELKNNVFLRDEIAKYSYLSLLMNVKDKNTTLVNKLVEQGVINIDIACGMGLIKLEIPLGIDSILTHHNEQHYMTFNIEGNKLNISGNINDNETKWISCIIKNKGQRISEKYIPIDSKGNLSSSLDVNFQDESYEIEIYKAPERYTTYWNWINNITLIKDNTKIYFKLSPVYTNNYQKFYIEKKEVPSIDMNKNNIPKEIVNLSNEITAGIKSDYDKAMAIHDWVADNIYYNYDGYYSGDYGATSAEGTLKSKTSVCAGYAELTKALFTASNIPCVTVSGFALGISTNGEWTKDNIDNTSNHAWNEAYIDGRWVIIDTTWSSNNKYENAEYNYKKYNHNFFDVSLEHFSNTHKIISYN